MLFDLPVMLVIVLFLALGIFSQWLANRIKWPSIVVMSIVGLLVGPILGLANPEHTQVQRYLVQLYLRWQSYYLKEVVI